MQQTVWLQSEWKTTRDDTCTFISNSTSEQDNKASEIDKLQDKLIK